jgi:hypothetical protein
VDRDIPALVTLGLGDQQHLLLKEHLVGFDVDELRDPGAGLEERLDEQPPRTLYPIRMGDQLAFLFSGEPGHDALSRLRPLDGQCPSDLFGHVVGLIIGEVVLAPEFCGGRNDRFQGRN